MICLGDIHGNFKLINQYGLSKCNVIQVGDFGLGFDKKDEKTMDYWNTSWKARGTHVYAIRGNHDKPEYWDGRFNGRWTNITLVPDYTVMQIEGLNVLFMGGAISVDRSDRREGYDWWPDEEFNYDEEKLTDILKECNPIDIVVTHIAPEGYYPYYTGGETMERYVQRDPGHLRLEVQAERAAMRRAYNVICSFNKPKKWFYGHYHSNKSEFIEDVHFRLLGVGEITNI